MLPLAKYHYLHASGNKLFGEPEGIFLHSPDQAEILNYLNDLQRIRKRLLLGPYNQAP